MKFPLVVFSLVIIAMMLLLNALGKHERLHKALESTLPVYALLAVYALLSITFIGKPGLGPQYLAWLILIVQVIRGAVIVQGGRDLWVRGLGLLVYAKLGYLWFLQLPFFNQLPV